jgi:hypothetical protein
MNSGSVAATWVAVDFVVRLLIVWTIAAIRLAIRSRAKNTLMAGFALFACRDRRDVWASRCAVLHDGVVLKGTWGDRLDSRRQPRGRGIYTEENALQRKAYAR